MSSILNPSLGGFVGSAALVEVNGKFYVVSSVNAAHTGPETLAFPADAEGNVSSWAEVAGGRGMSRAEVIETLEQVQS